MTTITSKGQVTIPKRVRDALGLSPGAEVEVQYRSDGALVTLAKKKRAKSEIRKSFESIRGTIDLGGMTTDEYIKWLRGND